MEAWDDVVGHLVRTTPLNESVARRIVAEVVDFFGESADGFLRRRHTELQAEGLANSEIFPKLADELSSRPVLAPPLSERQIRRVIYG